MPKTKLPAYPRPLHRHPSKKEQIQQALERQRRPQQEQPDLPEPPPPPWKALG